MRDQQRLTLGIGKLAFACRMAQMKAAAFAHAGGRLCSLGTRILRAETAALAMLAILQYEWAKQH